MKEIVINKKTYKIKFGYNCFADTDLLERVQDITKLMSGKDTDATEENGVANVKMLFSVVRDLLFVGFKKYNPVDEVEEVGDLLDTYHEECPEGESRELMDIFSMLGEELMSEGFLVGLFKEMEQEDVPKKPQDHKKKATAKKSGNITQI